MAALRIWIFLCALAAVVSQQASERQTQPENIPTPEAPLRQLGDTQIPAQATQNQVPQQILSQDHSAEILREVRNQKQLLDNLVNSLNGGKQETHDVIRNYHSANTESDKSLSQNVAKLSELLAQARKEITEFQESTVRGQKTIQDALTSQASTLDTSQKFKALEKEVHAIGSSVGELKSSVTELATKLGKVLDQTKVLDQINKAQQKVTEQEKTLKLIIDNQKQILHKLEDKPLAETFAKYYSQLQGAAGNASQYVSSSFSSLTSGKGSKTSWKKLRKQADDYSKWAQGEAVKYHGKLLVQLKNYGIPDAYTSIAAATLLILPLSILTLLLVPILFKLIRVLASWFWYLIRCCPRRPVSTWETRQRRHAEDGSWASLKIGPKINC